MKLIAAASLVFSSALVACSMSSESSDEGTTSQVSEPIIGGSAATAYPEAILVDLYQSGQLVGYCSGSVIAPRVVLTAGHCVDGFTSWKITAPNAGGQRVTAGSGTTYDWAEHGSETVNPNHHDIGLIFLGADITLSSYPVLAQSPLASGASVVNIGRINNGTLSTTNLYVSKSIGVTSGAQSGFPFDYAATDVIQSGDSGGPDVVPGSSPHKIVAVNSGAGGSSEVLARVDLLASWISGQIASHGGSGSGSGSGSACAGGGADYQHPIALGGSACGSLAVGKQDWFSFSEAANAAYDVEVSAGGDAQLQMWKQTSSGYSQVANTTATGIAHTSSGGGNYVVVVYSPSSAAQSYTVTRK